MPDGSSPARATCGTAPRPQGWKALKPPPPRPELFNQLLIQKLEEVARELKALDPEAYKRLGLEELVGKEGGEA